MASPNSSPKASWNLRRITPNSEQKSARKLKKVNRKMVWKNRVFVGGRVGYSSSSIGPIVACNTSSLISSLTLSSAFSAIISSIPAPYVRQWRYRSSPAAACFTFEVGPRFADDLMTGGSWVGGVWWCERNCRVPHTTRAKRRGGRSRRWCVWCSGGMYRSQGIVA